MAPSPLQPSDCCSDRLDVQACEDAGQRWFLGGGRGSLATVTVHRAQVAHGGLVLLSSLSSGTCRLLSLWPSVVATIFSLGLFLHGRKSRRTDSLNRPFRHLLVASFLSLRL